MSLIDGFLKVGLPGLIALAAVLLGSWLVRRSAPALPKAALPSSSMTLLAAIAICLGLGVAFATGARVVFGAFPRVPPALGEEWALYAGLLGCLVAACVVAMPARAARVAFLLATAAVSASILLIGLRSAMELQFGAGWQRVALVVVNGGTPLLLWWLLAGLGNRAEAADGGGRMSVVPLAGIAAGIAACAPALFFSRSLKLAELDASLGAIVGAACIGVALMPGLRIVSLVSALAAPVHACIWLSAYWYASTHWIAAAIGLVAPLGFVVVLIPGIRRRPLMVRLVIAVVASAALAGVAGLAAASASSTSDGLYG